jgi:phosphorylcholine metabolism protein LicD
MFYQKNTRVTMRKFKVLSCLLVAGIFLGTAPIQAFSADWSSIIKKQDYEIFVDIDSYDVVEGYPFIVTKTRFKNAQMVTLNQQKIQFIESVKNQQFDCKNPRFRTTSMRLYDKKNKLKGSDTQVTVFQPILAGSNEFAVGQLTCQVHQMVGGQ